MKSYGLSKLLFAVVAAVAGLVFYRVRKAGSRRVMAAVDAGEQCLACDGTNVVSDGVTASCQSCGHVSDLAQLRAIQPDQQALDAMLRAEDQRDL